MREVEILEFSSLEKPELNFPEGIRPFNLSQFPQGIRDQVITMIYVLGVLGVDISKLESLIESLERSKDKVESITYLTKIAAILGALGALFLAEGCSLLERSERDMVEEKEDPGVSPEEVKFRAGGLKGKVVNHFFINDKTKRNAYTVEEFQTNGTHVVVLKIKDDGFGKFEYIPLEKKEADEIVYGRALKMKLIPGEGPEGIRFLYGNIGNNQEVNIDKLVTKVDLATGKKYLYFLLYGIQFRSLGHVDALKRDLAREQYFVVNDDNLNEKPLDAVGQTIISKRPPVQAAGPASPSPEAAKPMGDFKKLFLKGDSEARELDDFLSGIKADAGEKLMIFDVVIHGSVGDEMMEPLILSASDLAKKNGWSKVCFRRIEFESQAVLAQYREVLSRFAADKFAKPVEGAGELFDSEAGLILRNGKIMKTYKSGGFFADGQQTPDTNSVMNVISKMRKGDYGK